METLNIFTGPPGAGKLAYVWEHCRHLPIYCCYHLNKKHWRKSSKEAALLCYSPSYQAKEYWIEQAREEGFDPQLFTLFTPKLQCTERMRSRPKNNRLEKEINDYFKNFTAHPDAEIVTVSWDPERDKKVYL